MYKLISVSACQPHVMLVVTFSQARCMRCDMAHAVYGLVASN